jgi:DNA-binding CsgD family transcriptional regulator
MLCSCKKRINVPSTGLLELMDIRHDGLLAAFQGQASLQALNRLDTSVLLVMADASIVSVNRRADTLLARDSRLERRAGRLTAACRMEDDRLSILIRDACHRGAGATEGVMMIGRNQPPALTVLVSPFRPASTADSTAGAIVFVRDPNPALSARAPLEALFELTPTEARIALALANGKTLAEVAAASRVSLLTVRKQCKEIFAKTGTNRQAQCVSVILRSVACITGD